MIPDPGPDAAFSFARAATALRYEDLPPTVVDVVKRSILDTLGAILAGTGLGDGSRRIVALVLDQGGRRESTILGTSRRVPCAAAALANGALAHAVDYDNVYSTVMVHSDAITVPTALAVAERVGGVSGRDLLAAVAAGDEIAARLGVAMFRPDRGNVGTWHPTLVSGYFGATAVTAKLLGLAADALVHAFGIALYRTGGTLAFLGGSRNLVAEVYCGFPAEVGVASALMARQGITGPGDALEGPGGLFTVHFGDRYDPAPLHSEWGADFMLTQVEMKPWPSVRTGHCYIQAALQLTADHRLEPGDVDEIVLHCGPLAMLACEPLDLRRKPATAVDARFSIPFAVAVALARGHVTIGSFSTAGLRDPVVLSLAERVSIRSDPTLQRPDVGAGSLTAIVEIKTKQGAVHVARVDAARGSPADPMSDAELAEKFADCASYAARPLSRARVNEIIDLVMTMDEMPDVAVLPALLVERATRR